MSKMFLKKDQTLYALGVLEKPIAMLCIDINVIHSGVELQRYSSISIYIF